MKFATYDDGSIDGRLLVVAKDAGCTQLCRSNSSPIVGGGTESAGK